MIDPESDVLIGPFHPARLQVKMPTFYGKIRVINDFYRTTWFWVDKLICENEMDLLNLIIEEIISIYKP